MYETDISNIKNYIDMYYPEIPAKFTPRRSYSKWALEEILWTLLDQELDYVYPFCDSMTPPLIVIQKFITKMDHFSRIGNYEKSGYVFKIAADSARGLLRYLTNMEKETRT